MKKTLKKSPYATFSAEPIKAPNPTKPGPKSDIKKGRDLRAKGAR